MKQILYDFWRSLDARNRTFVILAVAAFAIAALFSGVDLSWIPALLGAK